jgi:hypothetical protein
MRKEYRPLLHAALDSLKLRHSDSHKNLVFFESGYPHEALASAFLAEGIDIGRGLPPLERQRRQQRKQHLAAEYKPDLVVVKENEDHLRGRSR